MKILIAFISLFSMAFASDSYEVKTFKKDETFYLHHKLLELENTLKHATLLLNSCKNEQPDRIFDILINLQDEMGLISYEIEGCKYLIRDLGYNILD